MTVGNLAVVLVGGRIGSWPARSVVAVNLELAVVEETFPTAAHLVDRIERARWPTGSRCPYCNTRHASRIKTELRHHCNYCNTSFSVTTGTFLHGSRLDPRKWLVAVGLRLVTLPDVSARALAVAAGVNRNTACRMLNKVGRGRHEDAAFLTLLVELLYEEELL